jgi:hypothetical protein
MVGAGLALLATGPVLAQADNIATQTRPGIRHGNFISLSLGEIKRHYWRAVSQKNCVVSTFPFAQPQRMRMAIPFNVAVSPFTKGNPYPWLRGRGVGPQP